MDRRRQVLRFGGTLLLIFTLALAIFVVIKNNQDIFNPPAPPKLENKPVETAETPEVKYNFYGDLLRVRRDGQNEVLQPSSAPKKIRSWRVQIGAFRDKNQAEALLNKMKQEGHELLLFLGTRDLWLVQIVNLKDEKTARNLAHELEKRGIKTVMKQYE